MCKKSSHVASPPQDAPSISLSVRLFLHTKKLFCTSPKWFLHLEPGWTTLPQSNFVDPCVGDVWVTPLGNPCCFHAMQPHTHLALLFWDKMMHYWCATLASPLSTFSFVLSLNLWFCCQGSNGNLRICIDCWWFYCLSSGLVAPLSGWKYLIKQSAVSLWFTDANK